MTTRVVLFNLETNMYLCLMNPFTTVKDWREAQTFGCEEFALDYLADNIKIFQSNKLFNWCTRTFYNI